MFFLCCSTEPVAKLRAKPVTFSFYVLKVKVLYEYIENE